MSTEAVLNHHAETLAAAGLDGIMEDFTEDPLLSAPAAMGVALPRDCP